MLDYSESVPLQLPTAEATGLRHNAATRPEEDDMPTNSLASKLKLKPGQRAALINAP